VLYNTYFKTSGYETISFNRGRYRCDISSRGNIFSANPRIVQQMLASAQSMNNTIPIFSSNKNIDNTTLLEQSIIEYEVEMEI
jgi:hypothetical protein